MRRGRCRAFERVILFNLSLTLVVLVAAIVVTQLTVRWLGMSTWFVGMYFVVFVTSKYAFRICGPPADDTQSSGDDS